MPPHTNIICVTEFVKYECVEKLKIAFIQCQILNAKKCALPACRRQALKIPSTTGLRGEVVVNML